MAGYVCEYEVFPGTKWYSAVDMTTSSIGLVCTPLERRPPNTSWKSWANWYKITQLIQGFPF